ncbi:MAG: hypothetical protein AB1758_08370 [Candidatus Eremiobacterota bacterium]
MGNVLVLHADERARVDLSRTLAEFGHRALQALDAEGALEQAGYHAVDLILADTLGKALPLAQLRASGCAAPVLAVGNWGWDDWRVLTCLEDPVNPAELKAWVELLVPDDEPWEAAPAFLQDAEQLLEQAEQALERSDHSQVEALAGRLRDAFREAGASALSLWMGAVLCLTAERRLQAVPCQVRTARLDLGRRRSSH